MKKQNATAAFTYENIYGLCFCALQTHPLPPGTLSICYLLYLLSDFPKAQELLKSVTALEYVNAEGDI